jgi:hypothetical protein
VVQFEELKGHPVTDSLWRQPPVAASDTPNKQPSPCSINDMWDCGIVNHSPYAVLYGLPVAIIGIMGYGLLASLK